MMTEPIFGIPRLESYMIKVQWVTQPPRALSNERVSQPHVVQAAALEG